MNVLLTGASGFIGSHVANVLERQSHTRTDAQPYDVGIHLAWYVEPGKYLESPLNDQCRDESIALVKSVDCRRWVVAGSCFEVSPTTRYARAKRDLFLALQDLGINLAWPRLFYLYGPREHPRRFVPTVINALLDGRPAPLTAGDEERDYLHVADVAEALCAIATSTLTGIVNVGSGQAVTIRDLAERIARIIGRPELLRFGTYQAPAGDAPRMVADVEQLNAIWRPRVQLDDGLRETIEWWRQARSQTSES